MHFVFGGRAMGMLEYAESLMPCATVCDLAQDGPEAIGEAGIVCNVHLLVKRLVQGKQSVAAFFERHAALWQDKIVVGDEVGCGVVPVDASEREWRDEAGRTYQVLSRLACDVTRVWAGLPQALKRDGKLL